MYYMEFLCGSIWLHLGSIAYFEVAVKIVDGYKRSNPDTKYKISHNGKEVYTC